MSQNELILVTGAGGFIGGALVRYFREGGAACLRAVDNRLVDLVEAAACRSGTPPHWCGSCTPRKTGAAPPPPAPRL